MTAARLNGIAVNYEVAGSGDLVVLVMGTGSPGRVWKLHQVPALLAAGYRVATYDARGISSDPVSGIGRYDDQYHSQVALPHGSNGANSTAPMTIEDLVADLAALIEHLGGGPARVIGTSLGARVVQELALARPDLVHQAVAMAAHARLDPIQRMLTDGQRGLFDQRVVLPPTYHAAVTAVMNLSPATLRDEDKVREWLDVFEFSAAPITAGERAQLEVSAQLTDRLTAYRRIRVPTLVIGFADDVMIPAYLSREVAEAIPGARYVEVPETGHFGYLERPEEINRLLLEFLAAE
jgi:pimeloyl-ACP methyl ester carboxylesterase